MESKETNIFSHNILDNLKLIGAERTKTKKIIPKDCKREALKNKEAIKKLITDKATVIP